MIWAQWHAKLDRRLFWREYDLVRSRELSSKTNTLRDEAAKAANDAPKVSNGRSPRTGTTPSLKNTGYILFCKNFLTSSREYGDHPNREVIALGRATAGSALVDENR